MPKGSKTSIFVSSTCFDLNQIRADLREFAESIGFDPIMSEYDTFPVNPSQDTLNNCLEVVRNKADIFLLVIGGRYGTITDSGKSITNLEYSEACVKNIPKYIFIQKDILSLLQVWKDNPDADFSSAVDNPKLFEFISELKNSREIWIFPFSNAQEITNTLRKQLSYLLSESLDIRKKFYESDFDLSHLGSKALRLAIEKPKGWEWLLFAQILQDRIESYSTKSLDNELGICYGESISLDELSDVTSWVSSKFSWITNTIEQLTNALNNGFIKAVGETGEPGDIHRIIHLANRIGEGYGQLLDWELQFNRVSVDDDFIRIINLTSEFSSNAINEIEEFSANLYSKLEHIISNDHTYDEDTVITIQLTLTVHDTKDYINEINRLKRIYT